MLTVTVDGVVYSTIKGVRVRGTELEIYGNHWFWTLPWEEVQEIEVALSPDWRQSADWVLLMGTEEEFLETVTTIPF